PSLPPAATGSPASRCLPRCASSTRCRARRSRRSPRQSCASCCANRNRHRRVMRLAGVTVAIDIALIVAILGVQGLINDQWMYSHVGAIDSWFYLGYGLNYLDPDFFNHYYKVSRLPWVLAEFAVRSLFDPANANWVLQLTTLTLAGASLYMLL